MPFDPENVTPPGAKIKVIGVGGGGGNAVNTMIKSGLEGVDFVVANTDVQSLRFSLAGHKVQVGKALTRGLGAGADPDIGRDAALEDRHEIQELLTGADMVFITAGMGGGTGTGGASVVAQIARELGALTVAVVTKPFSFEGKRRRKHADCGIARLRECVDTLITIPNQRLLQVASPDLSMIDAFKMADDVLVNAVRGISDIINVPGTVNVDFADVKTVMSCMGQALMGIGMATGENRAVEAARQAICSPLLEDIDIEGATGILINITAGSDLKLMELNAACSIVQEAAHEDAQVIFGAVIDESLNGYMRVTVIATGFPVDKEETDGESTGKLVQPVTSFASRLTTHSLVTPASKPQPRQVTPSSLYAPLTSKRPAEAPRPQAAQAQPPHAPQAARSPEAHAPRADVRQEPVVHVQPSPQAHAPAFRPEPIFEAPVRHAAPYQAPVAPPAAPQFQPPPPAAQPASARDDAQELARWTLDQADGLFSGGDDIPSLAAEGAPSLAALAAEAEASYAPQPSSHEARLEGASAYGEADGVFDPGALKADAADDGLAASLFEAGFVPASEYGEHQAHAAAANDGRPGAVSEPGAPLESFFDPERAFLATDIDRKIDEALELAERMRSPRRQADADDLDVPAFLRNGMKDLPLD